MAANWSMNISEIASKLDDGLTKLNEVRQNLADMDIGDELLQLIDDGIQDVKNAHTLLNKN
jgi:hypothetical protein